MEHYKNSGHFIHKGKEAYYEEFGASRPLTPIVVCHMPAVHFDYLYLFKELTHHPVYFFSPPPSPTLSDYAKALKEFILSQRLSRPHIITHSYASAYALIHSLENPIASLTFLSPVFSTKTWKHDLGAHTRKEWKELLQKHLPKDLKNDEDAFLHIPFDFHLLRDLHQIKVPTYISVGHFDLVSPETACAIHNTIPHSHLEIFSSASHLHFLEAKDRFFTPYAHWLKARENDMQIIPQIINF